MEVKREVLLLQMWIANAYIIHFVFISIKTRKKCRKVLENS
jgi:hypothetical protein